MLFLARDHLYIWNPVSDSLMQAVSIETSSISNTSQPTDTKIELSITTSLQERKNPVEEGGNFEMIRQYLQESNLGHDLLPQDPLVMSADLEQSICSPQDKEVAESSSVSSGVGEGDVLVVCVEACSGRQLLSMYEALKVFYAYPEDLYHLHRTRDLTEQ